jgi:hypothetical protein
MKHRFVPTALVATLVVAAAAVPASSGGSTVTAASGCHWQGFKIYERENTRCSRAKKVLGDYYGEQTGASDDWNCDTTNAAYTKGHCKKGQKKFKWKPRN